MKTQVNQYDHHFGILTLLVSASLILLAFGIFKVFSLNSNDAAFNFEETSVQVNEQIVSSELGDFLYTHHLSEDVMDEPLLVEDWMTDVSSWNSDPSISTSIDLSEVYMEETLPIENWMTDLSSWSVEASTVNNELFSDYEPELAIEPWMLDTESWVKDNSVAADNAEDDIKLESWMMNIETWDVPFITTEELAEMNCEEEEELALESWMMNCCTWVPEKYDEIDIYEFNPFIMEESLVLESWMLDDTSWFIEDDFIVDHYPLT